jgi:hypothetical protein
MKRFAEDTKEYSKEKEWWHNIPLRRESVETPAPLKIKPNTKPAGLEVSNKPSANTLVEKDRKRKHHHRKRKSESALPADDEKNKKSKLEKLRQERLEREHLEQKRTKELFEPKKTPTEVKSQLDQDRGRRYNSQFNPEYINKKKIN